MTPTTARTLLLPLLTLGLALSACEKDDSLDPPIEIPSAAPTASVDLEPDAGAGGQGGAGGGDGGSGGAEPKKPTGPWDPLRISGCCDALQANRQGAPPMQRGVYDVAIATCNQARNNPAVIHRVRQLVPGIPACQ